MKQKSVRIAREIAKIALLLCVLSLLGLLGYYTYRSVRFRPYKVRVSNVTDSAFTVSWVTDSPMVGVVYYGEKDNFLPGPLAWIGKKKAVDDRDYSNAQTECVSKFNKKASKSRDENFTIDVSGYDCNEVKVLKKDEYYTHHVTVQNLDAEKEYFFRVGNGYISYKNGKTKDVEYIEREMPAISEFKQKTQPTITDVTAPSPAYGTSYNLFSGREGQIGMRMNFDSVIFLKTFKGGIEYPLMSAVCNSDGGWSIDLANVRENDGTSLGMEDTYLEFIPQVDNTRPGASGTTKFENLEFPLDLMGNNVDDLQKELKTEESELGQTLKDLVGKSHAAPSCYCASMGCRSVSTSTCGAANCHPTYKTCCLSRGLDANCKPLSAPTKVTCYKDACPAQSALLDDCGGNYPRVSPPDCRSCFKCEGGQVVERLSDARGFCPSGYSERRPSNCATPTKVCYSCKSDGTIAERTMETCTGIWKDSKTSLNCTPVTSTVNCFCTSNKCGNKLNKEGTVCNASDGCYADKATCQSKLEPTSFCFCTGNSCASKLEKKGSACKASDGCYADKATCQSKLEKTCYRCEGKRVISRKTTGNCNSGEFLSKPTCVVAHADCGSNGNQNYINIPIVNPQPNGPQTRTSLLERLFVRDAYAKYIPTPSISNLKQTSDTESGSCNDEGGTDTPQESTNTQGYVECKGSDCKYCWSQEDCFLVKVEKGEGCPSGYQVNTKDKSVCPGMSSLTGKFTENPTVIKNCTKGDRNNPEPGPGITQRIVSGGCNQGCWLQYLNNDGSVCGAMQLNDSVYCENQYCPNQQKKALELNGQECYEVKCENEGGCVCPEDCGGGISIKKGEFCGTKPEEPVESLSECYCLSDCTKKEEDKTKCRSGRISCFSTSTECKAKKQEGGGGLGSSCYYIENGQCTTPKNGASCPTNTDIYTSERNCLHAFSCFYNLEGQCLGDTEEGICTQLSRSGFKTYKNLRDCNNQSQTQEDVCYRNNVVKIGRLQVSKCVQIDTPDRGCSGDGYYPKDPSCGGKNRDVALYGFQIYNPYKLCVQGPGGFTNFDNCERLRVQLVFDRQTAVNVIPVLLEPLDNYSLWENLAKYQCCEYTNNEGKIVRGFVLDEGTCLSEYEGVILSDTNRCIPTLVPTNTPDDDIHDAPPETVERLVDNKLVFKTSAEEERTNEILYLPEAGIHMVKFSKSNVALPLLGGQHKRYLFFENRDGVDGYQPPEDPEHPKENEDMIVSQSAVVVSVSQETTAKEMTFKKGLNIVSFNFLPSGLNQDKKMDSKEFLQLANSDNYNISRISYFSAGQWDGGTIYDAKTKKTKGIPFDVTLGKGYLIVAERDCTISVPAYSIESPVPIAFSSGWNLVGVHGYDKQYTAKSLINSVNSIEGLKANNVTYWPTSKSMYQGFQLSEGREYGQDFSISPDLGYFVRINEFTAKDANCKSINWQPGGDVNGKCN